MRPELPAQLDAIAVGETHVEHGHIRIGRRQQRQRLPRRAGLADDNEIRLRLQEIAQAPADHLVIVDEEDFHRHAGILSAGRRPEPNPTTRWPP